MAVGSVSAPQTPFLSTHDPNECLFHTRARATAPVMQVVLTGERGLEASAHPFCCVCPVSLLSVGGRHAFPHGVQRRPGSSTQGPWPPASLEALLPGSLPSPCRGRLNVGHPPPTVSTPLLLWYLSPNPLQDEQPPQASGPATSRRPALLPPLPPSPHPPPQFKFPSQALWPLFCTHLYSTVPLLLCHASGQNSNPVKSNFTCSEPDCGCSTAHSGVFL